MWACAPRENVILENVSGECPRSLLPFLSTWSSSRLIARKLRKPEAVRESARIPVSEQRRDPIEAPVKSDRCAIDSRVPHGAQFDRAGERISERDFCVYRRNNGIVQRSAFSGQKAGKLNSPRWPRSSLSLSLSLFPSPVFSTFLPRSPVGDFAIPVFRSRAPHDRATLLSHRQFSRICCVGHARFHRPASVQMQMQIEENVGKISTDKHD